MSSTLGLLDSEESISVITIFIARRQLLDPMSADSNATCSGQSRPRCLSSLAPSFPSTEHQRFELVFAQASTQFPERKEWNERTEDHKGPRRSSNRTL